MNSEYRDNIIKVALLQFSPIKGDVESNMAVALNMAAQARDMGAHIAVLPELFASSMAWDRISELAEPPEGRIIERICRFAAEKKLAFVAGSVLENEGGNYYNTSYIIDRDGTIAGKYRKIHLFGALDEGSYITSGDGVTVASIAGVSVASLICYDLRFPEPSREAVLAGTRILFYPSQFLDPREEHFIALLRARAIENFCFVVGCNRSGAEGAGSFFGCSSIWDPWGEPVVRAGYGQGIAIGELNLALIDKARRYMPVFDDRRPASYRVLKAANGIAGGK